MKYQAKLGDDVREVEFKWDDELLIARSGDHIAALNVSQVGDGEALSLLVDGESFDIVTDVQAIGCDFLVCSAYKFFGPHQGVLYGREEVLAQLEPYRVRPAPSQYPGSFEPGTQSHEGCAGITAAVDYLAWIGTTMGDAEDRRSALRASMSLLFDYEMALGTRLIEGLLSIDGVTVQGITDRRAFSRRVLDPQTMTKHRQH